MSPWLLKKFSSKTIFFSELIVVSTIIHCIIGLALFVLYRGQYESFSFEVHSKFNSDQQVLFLPCRGRSGHSSFAAVRYSKARARCPRSTRTGKGAQIVAKPQKQAIAHSSKLISPKTATMFLDKSAKSKVVANKKNKKSKIKPVKVVVNEAPAVQHEELTKPAAVKSDVKKQEEAVTQKITERESAPENPVQEVHNENAAAVPESSLPEAYDIAVGADASTEGQSEGYEFAGLPPEVARIYYAVQEEVTTRWKPPLNLPKDLVCTISVRLNREGAIADVAIKKSSGVLIYDLAASQAAQEMQLPQITWGKEFSIAFKL